MSTKRKIIGIPGYKDAKGDSFGAGINHLEFLNHFGNVRILMPWEDIVKIDMLYLPGGLDTQPARYGEVPGFTTSNQDVFKEYFFENKLHLYLEKNTPTLGVCLGAQELAVYYGCKLKQNLLGHKSSPERWARAHVVQPYQDTILEFNNKAFLPFEVNSHHHQALCERGLTSHIVPLLAAMNDVDDAINSYSDGGQDGAIIEAFTVTEGHVFGIQWHPEELYDEFSMTVINYLLNIKQNENKSKPNSEEAAN